MGDPKERVQMSFLQYHLMQYLQTRDDWGDSAPPFDRWQHISQFYDESSTLLLYQDHEAVYENALANYRGEKLLCYASMFDMRRELFSYYIDLGIGFEHICGYQATCSEYWSLRLEDRFFKLHEKECRAAIDNDDGVLEYLDGEKLVQSIYVTDGMFTKYWLQ